MISTGQDFLTNTMKSICTSVRTLPVNTYQPIVLSRLYSIHQAGEEGRAIHESSPILNDISAAESWNKVTNVNSIICSGVIMGVVGHDQDVPG